MDTTIGLDSKINKVPHEFEDIIESLGSFGHWQRVIFFLICLADIFGSFAMILPVFIGATPDWNCKEFQGVCEGCVTNSSTANESSFKTCHLENHNLTCTSIDYGSDFTSIVTEWNLVCSESYASDLITSMQMVGIAIGALSFGQISDIFGRKKPYFLAFTLLISAGFGSAFAQSWQVYAFCRMLVGLGFGSQMVINCVYPLEFVGQRWRTLCGTVGFWALGQVGLALIAFYVREWRHLTIATTITGVLFYITWFFIPESPRWLIQKGRLEEATAILSKIAKKNNKPMIETSEIIKYAEQEQQKREISKKYTYIDLFRTWNYCKRTLILLLAWFSSFHIYYMLFFNMKELSGNRYLNIVLGAFLELGAMLLVIPLNNILGRKPSFLLFMVVALVGNIVLFGVFASGVDKRSGVDDVIRAFALIGKSGATGATYIAQIFSAELYPTLMRNQGVGASSFAGRVGSALGPQMVYLGTIFLSVPYIVSSILCLIVLPLILLLPETKGQPLEDVVHITTNDHQLANGVLQEPHLSNESEKMNTEIDNGRGENICL